MQRRVLRYIRKHGLMRPGDRVGVAVSGGADSVGLLRLLLEARAELGIVLSVLHFNHKMRGAEAEADEEFVRELARRFELEFHCDSDDTRAYARAHKMSLEAAGRKLRYGFSESLLSVQQRPRVAAAPKTLGTPSGSPGGAPGPTTSEKAGTLDRVATAHTRDDQAETVIMRFLRGSGTRGMAGIYPAAGEGGIVRPLLEVTREQLREYLNELGQSWREDASNLDVNFTRNRLRHEIMPVLRKLNPNLEEGLSDTAEIAREEESWWNEQMSAAQEGLWVPRPVDLPASVFVPPKMLVNVLLSKPVALQRRLIRMMVSPDEQARLVWGPDQGEIPHLEFCHVEAVRELAAAESSRAERVLELPGGCEAVRQGEELWFRRRCPTEKREYDCPLGVPGEVQVADWKIKAALVRVPHGSESLATQVLLDPALAQAGLRVRHWQAGDRYWPAHTKEPKKLKELLQARHIPREQKPYWPVVVNGKEIVWVPGFAAPERFQAGETDSEALLLEEVSGDPHPSKTG